MDPNKALEVIREEIQTYHTKGWVDTHSLMDHLEALDDWLTGGGFLPAEWTH